MPKGNCEFRGRGGQYFATYFIHLFLINLLTLGIYSAWAWVRLLKLKASHSVINGKQVSFTGKGGELFGLILVGGLLTVVTLGFYGPWAMCRIFRWRVHNTLVGGKPSRFLGTGGALFLFSFVHLFLLPMLTLGIYSIVGMYRLYAWKEEHARYGGERTSFGSGFGGFFKASLVSWILNSITFGLFTPWSLCMFYRWQMNGLAVGEGEEVKHFLPVRTNPVVLALLIVIGLAPFAALYLHRDALKPYLSEIDKLKEIAKLQTENLMEMRDRIPSLGKPPSGSAPKGREKAIRKRVLPPQASPPSQEVLPTEGTEKKSPDYAQEISHLNTLVKQDPQNENAFYNRAWFFAQEGNLEQSLKDYTRAIELNNKDADAYYNRGLVYVGMKKLELAIKDFDEAIRLAPENADPHVNRGSANFELGKKDLAVKDYTAALKMNPNDAETFYNRGLVFLAMGNKVKAAKDLETASKLGCEEARQILAGGKERPKESQRTPARATPGKAAEAPEKTIPGWKDDLRGVDIPDTLARGMIQGETFVVNAAKIKNNVLTLSDGEAPNSKASLLIFLFLKKGESIQGKSYNISTNGAPGAPHIHLKRTAKNSKTPTTRVFTKNYSMRLDLAQIQEGKIPARIYLCLPDEKKSFVAGKFVVDLR